MRTVRSVLRRMGLTALAFTICGAGLVASGSPAAAAEPTTTEIKAALSRISDGTWTEKDIALIQQVPEVGRVVPDPRDPGTLTAMPAQRVEAPASARGSVAALAAQCWSQWSYVEKKDVFGSRIYRFNVETEWCYDTVSYQLTGVHRAVGYINNATWGIYHRGWQVDSFGVRGGAKKSGWHQKRANIEYCVGGDIGCYTTTYPYINIELGSTAGSSPWSWKVAASSAG